MAHLRDLVPRIREKAQAAMRQKSMPPPTPMEVEEAGEYLLAYREFWKRVDESGSGTPDNILGIWWSETFGQIRPATYLGFSLVNDSVCVAAQHQGAQTAFFVVFASGITGIMFPDEIETYIKSLETDTYEGLNSDLES